MTWQPYGLDHVGLTCLDLDRSVAFYHATLGLPVRGQGRSTVLAAENADATYAWADIELSDGRVIELIQFTNANAPAEGPSMTQPGGAHFALRVDDINATLRRLAEAGVHPATPPRTISERGAWQGATIAFVNDPNGHTIELVQWPSRPE